MTHDQAERLIDAIGMASLYQVIGVVALTITLIAIMLAILSTGKRR